MLDEVEVGTVGTDKEEVSLHLLLSCILATKPVRGICGVSWGMGGGGGATDTESQQRDDRKEEKKRRTREKKRNTQSQ